METYKQKYENALEYMRKVYPTLKGADKEDAEHHFPELKENDWISKEIRDFIHWATDRGSITNEQREKSKSWLAWLEKQSKQEQLYIRFGEIPTGEKSKIYQGEVEVGTENGVSVYPAFKTDEGDIVLGLSLPITKTTLYTQQHLIEYDNRPCYLVRGDYVGKDTDGQPLINNISIIEKIDGYRVKEETQSEQKPADKVEPKFKVGDWIVSECDNVAYVESISKTKVFTHSLDSVKNLPASWYNLQCIDGYHERVSIDYVDRCWRLWTIQDAKDGDVLVTESRPFIFRGFLDICYPGHPVAYCGINIENNFYITSNNYGHWTNNSCLPATKKQCDFLFLKMKEAGYEWDAEKKELKKKDK